MVDKKFRKGGIQSVIIKGNVIEYTGEVFVNTQAPLELGELFRVTDVEITNNFAFYWVENYQRQLVLMNDEIKAFKKVKLN